MFQGNERMVVSWSYLGMLGTSGEGCPPNSVIVQTGTVGQRDTLIIVVILVNYADVAVVRENGCSTP